MWKNDRYNGPGIIISDNVFSLGTFRNGRKIKSSTAAEFQYDDKWAALFQGCAELLQQMVQKL